MMAAYNRAQPLAWQTKVVHQGSGCIKADSRVLGCENDSLSSKPVIGRDKVDDSKPLRGS